MRWILLFVLSMAAGSAVGDEPPMPAPVQIDPAEGAKEAFARPGNQTPSIEPYLVAGEKWLQIRIHEYPDFGAPQARRMTIYAVAPSIGQIRCVTAPPAKRDGDDQITYRLQIGDDYARHAVLVTVREIRSRADEDPDGYGMETRRTTWSWNLETGRLTWLFTDSGQRSDWSYSYPANWARIADLFDYDVIWAEDPEKQFRGRLRFEPRPGNPRPSRSTDDHEAHGFLVAGPERTVITDVKWIADDGPSLIRYSFDDPKRVLWRHTSADYRRQSGRGGHVKRIVHQLENVTGDVFPVQIKRQDDSGSTHEIWLINVADGTFNRRILPDAVLPSLFPRIKSSHDGRYLYVLEQSDRQNLAVAEDLAETFFDVTKDRIVHRRQLPPDERRLMDHFTCFLAGRGVRVRQESEQIELFDLANPEQCEIIFDLRKLADVPR